jgi:hypothetical protein
MRKNPRKTTVQSSVSSCLLAIMFLV